MINKETERRIVEAKKELIIQWCNEGKLRAVDGDIYTLMELSFEAGYILGTKDTVEVDVPKARLDGIREAVNEYKAIRACTHMPGYHYLLDCDECQQAKLREWELGD